MRPRGVRVAAAVAAAAVIASIAFLATRPVEQGATVLDSPLVGTKAPTVITTTLAGTRFDLAALRGHVVVLSFFASWCAPCKDEAPELATFAYDQRSRGATTELYGVVYNDANVAAAAFVRTYGGGYQALADPNGTIAGGFGVTGPPVTVVIDANGTVAAILEGAVTARQLDGVVAAAGVRAA